MEKIKEFIKGMLPVFSPVSCLLLLVLGCDWWPQPELSLGVCTCGQTINNTGQSKKTQ